MEKEDFIKWFSGFFDGEGSVGIQMFRNKSKTGLIFQPKLQIAQSDFNILSKIKTELQLTNKIQLQKLIAVGKYMPTKPVNMLAVSNVKDCLRIINLILPYSLLKKEKLQLLKEFIEILGNKYSRKDRKLLTNKYIEFYPNLTDLNKQKILNYIS